MKSPDQLYGQVTSGFSKLAFLPPLLARATLAAAFIASGRKKLSDLKGNADYFREMGIPMADAMVPFVSANEVACGALLGAGLGTRLAALPLIPVMGVAILTARRKEIHSFSDLTGVYEFSYILLLGYLATHGAGAVSLDSILGRVREKRALSGQTKVEGREQLRVA